MFPQNSLKFDQLKNELALKAVAWDFEQHMFVSPSKKEFTWNPDGLEAAECDSSCQKEEPPPQGDMPDELYLSILSHYIPGDRCSCGIYSTFRWDIVRTYTGASPISAVLLLEAVGKTILYWDGMRTYQAAVRAIVKAPTTHWVGRDNLILGAAHQAADYFHVPVIDWKAATVIMDMWNIVLNEDWHDWYRPESERMKKVNEADVLQYREMLAVKREVA